MTPENCPNCGADVPPNAKACPECGSCEETGWSDDAHSDRLGLPEDSFDYDEFVDREFGGGKKTRRRKSALWLWWGLAVLIGVTLAMFFLRR